MVQEPEPLSYVAQLITAHAAGYTSDHMHLGWFAAQDNACAGALDRAQTAMVERHLLCADAKDGNVILDIGCGLGGTLRMINEQRSGVRLIGVNIDPRQLAIARRLIPMNNNSFEWITADGPTFIYPNLKCDILLSVEAMFHFSDVPIFFRKIAQVLQPGGRAAVSTILLSDGGNADLNRSVSVITHGYAPWPLPNLSLCQLLDWIHEAQLDIFSIEDLTDAVAPTFDIIAEKPPANITTSALIEMRRLLDRGGLRYVMLGLKLHTTR